MPAITGKDYIERIDQLQTDIWIDGSQVKGKVSEHTAFKGVIESQAALYDLQHDNSLKIMRYASPTTGDLVGTSYMKPKTKEDLAKRRAMIQQWAQTNGGLMGRSPDYMNTVLMAFASSADLLIGRDNCFPDHLINFYEHARENDLSLTHTFVNPQVNRSEFYFEESDEPIAAKIVDTNKSGIVIKGARLLATQGGITDEILVLSKGGGLDEANSYAFSIPSNTKGLKFICRESFVYKDSTFDYPLSSRFEEMDSVVVFDDVLVPWERVFFYHNMEVSNSFQATSAFVPFTQHQVVSRQIVKIEFVLGIVQTLVNTIKIDGYQHVQDKVSEVIIALETMKALVIKSEVEARLDQWGVMRPDKTSLQIASNTFPRIYPRITEIVRHLGASGLISIPTEKDFQSEVRSDLDQYLQSAGSGAEDRVKLFRLAWDLCMSAFGTRQTLYERFFFGDPVRLSGELYRTYDKEKYVNRIHEFLQLKS